MIENYIANILIYIALYAIMSLSLNLALGYTGLLNLGHFAFVGVGAYTSALLAKIGFPFIIALLCGGLLTVPFAFLLVLATRKIKGDYLALATLAFGFVINSLFLNLDNLTGGPMGLDGIPFPSFLGIEINSVIQYLIFIIPIAILVYLIIYYIANSSFGRLLQATRDDEIRLRVMGKDTFKLKAKAMMISAFFAGIGGSLFAHYVKYIVPHNFFLPEILLIFTIVIAGGIASLRGTVIATVIVMLVPEALRFLKLSSSIIGPGREILFSAILIGIFMYKPKGLFGRVDLK